MLTKVISGGQTGTDKAGLVVAKSLNFETGGFVPHGFRTTNGADLTLKEYNVTESVASNYAFRTELNVRASHGTIRVACDLGSPGEILTRKLCIKHANPMFDVLICDTVNFHQDKYSHNMHYWLRNDIMLINEDVVDEFKTWIYNNNIIVLNVAGNSEMTIPGMFDTASEVLTKLLVRFK